MTLVEFLLARIAEDEAVAGGALRDVIDATGKVYANWWAAGDAVMAAAPGKYIYVAEQDEDIGDTAVAEHIARHDPARVLAECEAKRFVIDALRGYEPSNEWGTEPDMGKRANNAAGAMRRLALPYASHPDYDESWRA